MSDKFKRRRRRTGSTSSRFRSSQLVPVEAVGSAKVGKAELLACVAVSVVAIALITLIWIVTGRAVQEQNAEIRYRAEQSLMGQAATIAETVSHELLLIDQSLTIIQEAWKVDSDAVNLDSWQKQFPALLSVADDIFISDEKHIIRQDILPKAVGQGVGAAYVTFPHGSLEQYQSDGTKDKAALLLQGEAGGAPIDARQFLMYVVRPLDHPKNWLVGASYRSEELTKLFAGAALGFNPVVALVDTRRGIVQAVVGPSARRPKTDVSKTPLFDAIAHSNAGSWLGETALDGATRLHAFHHVANRDMAVVVAANWAEVMAPAASLAAGAHSLALITSAVIVIIGGVVLGELYRVRGNKRQKRILERNRNELQRLRDAEVSLASRATLNAARLQAVVNGATDGIALFDSALRLVQCNHPFVRGIGVALRPEMPLHALLRDQGAAGLFDPTPHPDIEIARRTEVLREGQPEGLPQPGPENETLILRGQPIAEGGVMLMLNGLRHWQPPPAPAPVEETESPAIAEPVRTPVPLW